MSKHAKPSFSYLIHIAATPDQRVAGPDRWGADPAILVWPACRIRLEGRIAGDVLVRGRGRRSGQRSRHRAGNRPAAPPVLHLQVQFIESMRDESPSRVTFEIEPEGEDAKLTVTHDELEAGGEVRRGGAQGLAGNPLQPQEPGGDRRAAGADQSRPAREGRGRWLVAFSRRPGVHFGGKSSSLLAHDLVEHLALALGAELAVEPRGLSLPDLGVTLSDSVKPCCWQKARATAL